jgi:hypothetical protein
MPSYGVRVRNKTHNGQRFPNVLVSLSPNDQPRVLLRHVELARLLSVSPRTLDNFKRKKIIPCIKVSNRLVRYHLPSVLAALGRFELKERR